MKKVKLVGAVRSVFVGGWWLFWNELTFSNFETKKVKTMKNKKYLLMLVISTLIVVIAVVALVVVVNSTPNIGSIPNLVEARYWGGSPGA